MSRPVWFVNLIKKAFPGRFLLARLTHYGPIGQIVNRWLFEGDDLAYLPSKIHVPVESAPESEDDYVLPNQVIDHFIDQAADLWIMHECICRGASTCESFPIDLGCLFMGSATRDINPRLGRPVDKLEARAHVERARENGLIHLIGRNKLDTVWLGVGPGEKLLTVCNCCPCCCLWRMHPELTAGIRATLHRLPGVSLTVSAACSGCELCLEEVCFVSAIEFDGGKAVITEGCLGCGRCVDVCPEEAIRFNIADTRIIETAIGRIEQRVDIGSA